MTAGLVKAEFDRDWINEERDLLCNKNPKEVLYKQLHVANEKEDVHFLLGHCWELKEGVNHDMEPKLSLDKHNE